MNYDSFVKYRDDFLVHLEVERNLSKNTYAAYESDLKLFELFWIDHKKERDIITIIERFFVHMYNKKTQKVLLLVKYLASDHLKNLYVLLAEICV